MSNDESKVIEIEEHEVSGVTKWEGFKFKVRTKWNEFKNWIGSKSLVETMEIITVVSSTIGIVFKAIRSCRKTGTERLADLRDYGYYDPHTGIRWDLKRKLTNNEKHELRVRMEAGEPTEDILKDLGVYKYR